MNLTPATFAFEKIFMRTSFGRNMPSNAKPSCTRPSPNGALVPSSSIVVITHGRADSG